jgi:hypothetical protein
MNTKLSTIRVCRFAVVALLWLATIFSLSCAQQAADFDEGTSLAGAPNLRFVVRNAVNGRPITGASVTATWPSKVLQGTSDAAGAVSFTDAIEGTASMRVTASGYSLATGNVSIFFVNGEGPLFDVLLQSAVQ